VAERIECQPTILLSQIICSDTAGIYIVDAKLPNSKWPAGAIHVKQIWRREGMGSNANQLSYPNYFTVDATGTYMLLTVEQ
jgi:hypothetical protein